jgi:hypothetical protein
MPAVVDHAAATAGGRSEPGSGSGTGTGVYAVTARDEVTQASEKPATAVLVIIPKGITNTPAIYAEPSGARPMTWMRPSSLMVQIASPEHCRAT